MCVFNSLFNPSHFSKNLRSKSGAGFPNDPTRLENPFIEVGGSRDLDRVFETNARRTTFLFDRSRNKENNQYRGTVACSFTPPIKDDLT